MDVAEATSGGASRSWHDNVGATVVNNVIADGDGAGVALYSARDAFVAHNTLLRVARSVQAAVLLNVSPKLIGPWAEVGPPCLNITLANNVVVLPAQVSVA